MTKPCPDCGTEMFEVPEIHDSHFAQARFLADLVWRTAEVDEQPPISAACLTAALLFKRACVALKLKHEIVLGLAGLYLNVVHELIQARRLEARKQREQEN